MIASLTERSRTHHCWVFSARRRADSLPFTSLGFVHELADEIAEPP